MIAARQSFPTRLAGWFLMAILSVFTALQAQAVELKVEARLIWGTNDDKSPDPSHKPVDDATAAKLRKIFKWKNYFEVNKIVSTVPSRGAQKFQMSKKCLIEITELPGPNVEVKLVGDGKPVNKTTKGLRKGESFTLGGEDKNGSAWFVIVTELEEK